MGCFFCAVFAVYMNIAHGLDTFGHFAFSAIEGSTPRNRLIYCSFLHSWDADNCESVQRVQMCPTLGTCKHLK